MDSLPQWVAIAALLLCSPINYLRARKKQQAGRVLRAAGYLGAATFGALVSAVLVGMQAIPIAVFWVPVIVAVAGHHYAIKHLSVAG